MSFVPPPPALPVFGSTSGEPFGPPHLPHIREIMQATLSQHDATRKEATDRIESLKNHPGWRVCLLMVALHPWPPGSVTLDGVDPDSVRMMCLIQFKNQIDVMFRRTFGLNAISRDTEEKDTLKTMLLQFHSSLDTPNGIVLSERNARFVSVCIGMVARYEWPAKWPALFPQLFEGIQSSNPRTVACTASTLHQVMKSLQSSQLFVAKQKFQRATEAIITSIRTKCMAAQEQIMNTITAVVASGNASAFNVDLNKQLVESCELVILFLKCLRRLVLYGVADISTSPDTQQLFPFYLSHLQKLVVLLPQLRIPPTPTNNEPTQFPFYDRLHSIALLMQRTVSQALDAHAVPFRPFFVPFVQFSIEVLQSASTKTNQLPVEDLGTFPERGPLEAIAIEAMNYLQAVIRLYSRPPAGTNILVAGVALRSSGGGAGGAAHDAAMAQIHSTMDELFPPSTMHQLMTLLLTHYLVLKHSDMECWQNEAETFYNEERSGACCGDDGTGDDQTLVVLNVRGDGGGGDSTARMQAETLIKTLLEKYPEVLAPYLVQTLMQLLQTCPPGVIPAPGQTNMILLKESLYSCLGYAYLHVPSALQQHNIPFPTFFAEVLAKELDNTSNGYKIIRRRVIWLVGEWVEEMTDDLRLVVYGHIVRLLKEEDLLVRMTAIDTLFKLIDNFHLASGCEGGDDEDDILDLTVTADSSGSPGFEALLNQFAVHLKDILALLFHVLQHQLEELPTKQHVLLIISKIVGSMKSRIITSGCLDSLLHNLPLIWQTCQTHNQSLLRTAILDVIKNLVIALSWKSQAIHQAVVIPMLAYIMDPKNTAKETNVLVQQGLELWLHTLQQCVTYTPQLGELFGLLLSYMSNNTAHLQECVEIIESYIHLGREEFMKVYAGHIGELFASLLTASNAVRPEVVSSHGQRVVTEDAVTENAIVVLMPVLEAIAQIYPAQVPMLFVRTFHLMISSILDSAQLNDLSDEQQQQSSLTVPSDQVLSGYFTVLGRLFFQNFEGSMGLLQHLSGNGPGQFPIPANQILSTIINVWNRKLDSIVNTYKKKVCVLGMIHTIQTADPVVLSQLKWIMSCVRRVEMELAIPGYNEQPDWSVALHTPAEQRIESHRIQLMLKDDPSNALTLRNYLLDKLTQLSTVIGSGALEQLIGSTCEPRIWQQIRDGQFGPIR